MVDAPDAARPIPTSAAQNIADHYRYDTVIVIGVRDNKTFVAASPLVGKDMIPEHHRLVDHIGLELDEWENGVKPDHE